jgi:hypothetical protein
MHSAPLLSALGTQAILCFCSGAEPRCVPTWMQFSGVQPEGSAVHTQGLLGTELSGPSSETSLITTIKTLSIPKPS